ncbi:MAG: DUF4870 domain-containing protein [Chloroflexi bacterium]|nr:DUF4870 domain-containing protein [Chloroflexota bacterium]
MAEQTHSAESRLLAALAHAAIITQALGVVVGVIVYLNQRSKSAYAAFQALQAAVYQTVTLIIVILSWIVWTACYLLSFVPLLALAPNPDEPGVLFWVVLGSLVLPLGLMVLLGIYGLIGALSVWGGNDFRYAIIGPWLERSGLWQEDDTPAETAA